MSKSICSLRSPLLVSGCHLPLPSIATQKWWENTGSSPLWQGRHTYNCQGVEKQPLKTWFQGHLDVSSPHPGIRLLLSQSALFLKYLNWFNKGIVQRGNMSYKQHSHFYSKRIMGPENNAKSLFPLFVGVCSFWTITAVSVRGDLHQAVMRHVHFPSKTVFGGLALWQLRDCGSGSCFRSSFLSCLESS